MWTWTNYNDELYHHGIKGQKWGIRRFQNEDGSLTPAGEKRYGTIENYNSAVERRKKNWKTAGKVALGVAATAAVGYGIHRVAKAYKGIKDTTKYLDLQDKKIAQWLKDDLAAANPYLKDPNLRNHALDYIQNSYKFNAKQRGIQAARRIQVAAAKKSLNTKVGIGGGSLASLGVTAFLASRAKKKKTSD